MAKKLEKTKNMNFEEKMDYAICSARTVLKHLWKYTKNLKPKTLQKQIQLYRNLKNKEPVKYKECLENGYDYLSYIQKKYFYTKGTYYNLKAAFRHGLLTEIYQFLDEKNKDFDSVNRSIQRVQQILILNPDPELMNKNEKKSVNLDFKKSAYNKKNSLKNLPKNWQGKIIKLLPEQYKLAGKIISLTGCRASEIEKGIDIIFHENKVEIKIKGSKVTKYAGHPVRQLFFKKADFEKEMKKSGLSGLNVETNTTVKIENIKNFTDKILINAGQRAGFNTFNEKGAVNLVTMRTFRHQISADLKKSGLEPKEIALIMGHRVTRTQQKYSRKKSGKGGHVLPVGAEASYKVKDNISTNYQPKSKTQVPRVTF
ncbi:MAG: hypothetical protein ACOC2M_03065 [bacterium]